MIVEWVPQNQYAADHIPPPKPAKNYIPDWYKNLSPFAGGHTPTITGNRADSTEKLCMPLLDSFTTGYIQEAWCDISISIDDDGNLCASQASHYEQIINHRKGDNQIIPKERGFVDFHINWFTQWEPRTPKGWSTYYTHPLNQFDLPFRTIDGIIDTDRWWIGGSVPFLLQEGFQGIIPQGTPLYQMFFIKREPWKSKVVEYSEKERMSLHGKVFNSFYGGYRKCMWEKKTYE